MTLDGKIATRTGDSRWISNPQSRADRSRAARPRRRDHGRPRDGRLRRSAADRPAARSAHRRFAIVVDTRASLGGDSQLVQHSARNARAGGRRSAIPAGRPPAASPVRAAKCSSARATRHAARLDALLDALGRRQMTNVLVEGGGRLLGSLLDARQIDEVHVFIAPKLIGGAAASSPIAGAGIAAMAAALPLTPPEIRQIGTDLYVRARRQPRHPIRETPCRGHCGATSRNIGISSVPGP